MNCKVLRTTAGLGWLFIACNAMAQGPNCQVSPIWGEFAYQGAPATMNVVSNGLSCGVDLYGKPGVHQNPASEGAITSPPKHGHAEFVGAHLQYTPATGYVGADEFSSTAWALDQRMRWRLLKVRMKVTVSAAR